MAGYQVFGARTCTFTFIGMSLALFMVGLLASYLPARKAAAVDPMESMRIE